MALVNHGLEVLFQLLNCDDPKDERHRTVRLVALRVFTTAGGTIRLARSGFFVQAFILVRDILECAFLLDMFARWPDRVDDWLKDAKRFSPIKVRKDLDEADGFTERKREAAYKALSNHAAHASKHSIQLLDRGHGAPLGPAPDPALLCRTMEELTLRFTTAVEAVLALPYAQPTGAADAVRQYKHALHMWMNVYLACNVPDATPSSSGKV